MPGLVPGIHVGTFLQSLFLVHYVSTTVICAQITVMAGTRPAMTAPIISSIVRGVGHLPYFFTSGQASFGLPKACSPGIVCRSL
jgi:hypothetical protein